VDDISKHETELESLGLDLKAVKKHQSALRRVKDGKAAKFFEIADTCRLDNSGVLNLEVSLKHLSESKGSGSKAPFAAFIPAAGAASRYIRPLADLETAIESEDLVACQNAILALKEQGAAKWPLPELLAELVQNPELCTKMNSEKLSSLKHETTLPKGLMPCVAEGHSFLALKMHEHRSIPEVGSEFYIVPRGHGEKFARSIEALLPNLTPLPFKVLEQHGGLSTIRFNPDCAPFRDTSGKMTLVPAGHGTLTALFPNCAGDAHSLFIRNIDNVMGNSDSVINTTSKFLALHDKILTLVRRIRVALEFERLAEADVVAKELLVLAGQETWQESVQNELSALWQVQRALFHTDMPKDRSISALKKLFQRPVNTLGQVPNTGKDVGGTPCFVDFDGRIVKICVEVPHASEDDKKKFFTNPEKATHFNPVFAAAEITTDSEFYQRQNDDFWLMAEKQYRGLPVIYYETVLYELIGNSTLANAIFVEVPRSIFNPHKAMTDAADTSIKDWLT
jgi:hypothetical protein